MVESVGKKLNQARLKRGLTVDEAAHATRLRPDKIAALENDDYSRFANNIYAKGFLQIYARYLGVDVSDFARTLDNANPISISDYQYLSNAPTPRPETTQVRREERKPPSLAPLFFFVFVIVVGAFGFWAYAKSQQLEKKPKAAEVAPTEESTGSDQTAPAPRETAPATPVPTVTKGASTPAAAPATPALKPNFSVQLPMATPGQLPAPAVAKTDPPKNTDQDFVTPTTVPTTDPSSHPLPPSGVNEVQVATLKKTWVTVRKDDPKAAPIFEDYVYPSANPLKLKGARFFIEVRGDSTAIQITKNGLPYAYQAPNVPVQ
jgi:cytoskeletal protein RodZ